MTKVTKQATADGPRDAETGVEDLVLLSPLSEAAIEQTLRVRFARDLIYTNIGPVLLAVNPFREIPGLYSDDMIEYYRSGGGGGGGTGGTGGASMLGSQLPHSGNAHIFALAEETYRTMVAEEEDQCVIISGESGAGKTEASKQIMRYISSVSGDTPAMEEVKRIMLESNPLMEAFGNAKTLRNDNSSRFGKFLQIHFDRRGGPVGGRITTFLLEKARVVHHQRGERNFHIFYQLCAGLGLGADGIVRRVPKPRRTHGTSSAGADSTTSTATDESDTHAAEDDYAVDHGALRERLRISEAGDFHYLRMGENLTRSGVNDALEWQHTLRAMHLVGMPEPVVEEVITTLALVLHIGQIGFTAPGAAGSSPSTHNDGGRAADTVISANAPCSVTNMATLTYCAALLGVSADGLARALTWRKLQIGQSEIVDVPLDHQQCQQARDAIAKALYDGVFNFIVFCVNTALDNVAAETSDEGSARRTQAPHQAHKNDTANRSSAAPPPRLMLGVLDIYGFEIFDSNGFEQFCINYVNEKLQQIFIELTLCAEQEEYVREGIAWEPVQYFDNRVVVDLIESSTPPVGLFAVMDDVCAAMAKEDESVVDAKLLDKLESAASGHVTPVRTLYDERHPEEVAQRAEQWERQERERMLHGDRKATPGKGADGDGADEETPIQADFGAAHFVRTDGGFVIKHYAGDVRYTASGFTARNKDRLSKDVTAVLASSTNRFLRTIFTEHGDVLSADELDAARDDKHRLAPPHRKAPSRTTTAGTKIRAQAAELVQTLKRCNPHYVRTIKSNDKKQGGLFDDARVRHQIKYLGLLENVRVRRAGYSYRQYYDKFLKRFRYVCPQTYPRPYKGSDTEACQVLLQYVSTHHSHGPTAFPAGAWQAGANKLFIRQPSHLVALEQARTEAFDTIAAKLQRAWRRYVNRRLFVQLKSRMSSLYAAHHKARRADSIFRPYQGTYGCRWWLSATDEAGLGDGETPTEARSGENGAAAAAAASARESLVERLLRPLIEYDPIHSAWREVRSPMPAATGSSAAPVTRPSRKYYVNDMMGQSQWEPPRGWRQGPQPILFMSPVWRLTGHDTAETSAELVVLTDRAVYIFREVLSVGDEFAAGNAKGTRAERPLEPRDVPPPSAYELRTRIDLRLLAGLSVSHGADEVLILHVFPLPTPYRPLLFHRSTRAASVSRAQPNGAALVDGKARTGRMASAQRPVCDCCGARLSPSLFVATEMGELTLSSEARRRHACPCCGRWCCSTRCLVHRRPLPTMTGRSRPVRVCPACLVGEPLEPLQDVVLFTPLKTELAGLLCRTYQQVMANALPLRVAPTCAPSKTASMLLYQLADDKGGPRGVRVETRTDASDILHPTRTNAPHTTGSAIDTVVASTGERGQLFVALTQASYWLSSLASTLLPPAVPYAEALRRTTPTTKERNGDRGDASAAPEPVTYMTVLAAPGIAPAIVDRFAASREARRQAAAALRRQEEEEMRRREAERERERAAAHQRLVQERKQARAAAELREEQERLAREAEAQERHAKRAKLLQEKQKLL